MRLIHSASEAKLGPVCVAIGFFDGVHLGHQQIIRQTVTDARQHNARSLVITFDSHPNTVVAPDRVPPLIYSLPQRLRGIKSLGADAVWLIHFDRAFSRQTGEQFVRLLARDLQPVISLCVGANFIFGAKRSGNVALLKRLGAELGFKVHGLAAVALDGQTISSTRIRAAIRAGNLDKASQMLGRAYSIAGRVGRGDQLGRRLGFPTANLDTPGLALPPNGVYFAQAILGRTQHPAVVNIGTRPTLEQPTAPVRVEAHLLDFDGDLYGQELELVFVSKIRDERRFPSLAELQRQIARDVETARGLAR